ncbi:Uu.00g124980.m01.CDS01 [Anthostomella pinea]|uniref:Uu.00g124980.m01.CDS01 n=1 Tax=Anthostomella pinea TaxID=933095 RepID=A0AAI8VHL1_9PEZI|nr:Uu.00g124980.m01.CDS01 [Anthostomella pinea]
MLKPATLLLASAIAATRACDIPSDTLSNNITEGFAVQVQNASLPVVHNHYLNIWDWGGGDQHLFVSPSGNSTSALTLVDGVLTLPWDPPRRAVINGEYEVKDNTTKMFMTERGDPRAVFEPVYGCNPDTDAVQIELALKSLDTLAEGGNIGVRPFNGIYDFRYTPEGNTAYDPDRPWTKVTLVVVSPEAVTGL